MVERFLVKPDSNKNLTMAQKVAVHKVVKRMIVTIRATDEPWLATEYAGLEAFLEGLDREELGIRSIYGTTDDVLYTIGFTVVRNWWDQEKGWWQNAQVCSVYVPKLAELTKAIALKRREDWVLA